MDWTLSGVGGNSRIVYLNNSYLERGEAKSMIGKAAAVTQISKQRNFWSLWFGQCSYFWLSSDMTQSNLVYVSIHPNQQSDLA